MLIEFSVENYKCFKEKATFSMVADSELRKFNPDTVEPKDQLLNVAAIYGANASGKTSLTQAMLYFQVFAIASALSIHANQSIFFPRFRLDASYEDKPTLFKIVFLTGKTVYTYHLKVDRERVLEEFLYSEVNDEQNTIFERNLQDIRIFSAKPDSLKERTRLEIYQEQTRPNITFLSVGANLNVPEIQEVHKWLFNTLNVFSIDGKKDPIKNLSTWELLSKDPTFEQNLLKYFNLADISVKNIKIQKEELVFWHEGLDIKGEKIDIPFNFKDESDGTQRFFDLLGSIHIGLQAGRVLVLDELELHLHPLLTQALVKLFSNPKTNPRDAQLIFTTHTTELLIGDNFNLDQIWLVDRKGTPKASELYSLIDFQDLPDDDPESIKRQYLQGRFGAIPYIAGTPDLWE
jgi:AAA15 family ATPase/GTPase